MNNKELIIGVGANLGGMLIPKLLKQSFPKIGTDPQVQNQVIPRWKVLVRRYSDALFNKMPCKRFFSVILPDNILFSLVAEKVIFSVGIGDSNPVGKLAGKMLMLWAGCMMQDRVKTLMAKVLPEPLSSLVCPSDYIIKGDE